MLFNIKIPVKPIAQTNLLKLDRVQIEAMRVILVTTKDTPIETMRFMLDLPPTQTRQKLEQVKSYFSAVQNPHNPLLESRERHKGMQTGTGQVLKGSSRGLNTACVPDDKTRSGKGTKTDSGVSTRHFC